MTVQGAVSKQLTAFHCHHIPACDKATLPERKANLSTDDGDARDDAQ